MGDLALDGRPVVINAEKKEVRLGQDAPTRTLVETFRRITEHHFDNKKGAPIYSQELYSLLKGLKKANAQEMPQDDIKALLEYLYKPKKPFTKNVDNILEYLLKHYPREYHCNPLSRDGYKLIKRHPEDKNMIHTGIKGLDILLCPENPTPRKKTPKEDPSYEKMPWAGGFYAPKIGAEEDEEKVLSPIVVVEGSSGVGKTTLALQLACHLVKEGSFCFYYSLEQKPNRILHNLAGYKYFGFIDPKQIHDWNLLPWYDLKHLEYRENRLFFPLLSPIHQGDHAEKNKIFDQRFKEIDASLSRWDKLREHYLAQADKEEDGRPIRCFFIIDSLSAFFGHGVSRDQMHRLFSRFRQAQVPLLATLERQGHWPEKEAEVHFNFARYAADVLINLEFEYPEGYYRQSIEVTKTRYNRRILGKHFMKLKSPQRQTTRGFDNRSGVVVYPSMHFNLSHGRVDATTESFATLIPYKTLPIDNAPLESRKSESPSVEAAGTFNHLHKDTCFVISGPHGGHKFALATNLLLCRGPKAEGRQLIISLRQEREISLDRVALLDDLRTPMAKDGWDPQRQLGAMESTSKTEGKVRRIEFGVDKDNIHVVLLNFRMGQIMPEEFLYIIQDYLEENTSKGDRIMGVLFDDTAQLRTRFPFLVKDPLFLPCLVDVIKRKNLLSVFVDVQEDQKASQALLAAADCRIFIQHDATGGLIRLHTENVRGKDYDRKERTIAVPEKDNRRQLVIRPIEEA